MNGPQTCQSIVRDVLEHRRTARQVVDEALERAATHQERFRAFIALAPELARRQAEEVDAPLLQHGYRRVSNSASERPSRSRRTTARVSPLRA